MLEGLEVVEVEEWDRKKRKGREREREKDRKRRTFVLRETHQSVRAINDESVCQSPSARKEERRVGTFLLLLCSLSVHLSMVSDKHATVSVT